MLMVGCICRCITLISLAIVLKCVRVGVEVVQTGRCGFDVCISNNKVSVIELPGCLHGRLSKIMGELQWL